MRMRSKSRSRSRSRRSGSKRRWRRSGSRSRSRSVHRDRRGSRRYSTSSRSRSRPRSHSRSLSYSRSRSFSRGGSRNRYGRRNSGRGAERGGNRRKLSIRSQSRSSSLGGGRNQKRGSSRSAEGRRSSRDASYVKRNSRSDSRPRSLPWSKTRSRSRSFSIPIRGERTNRNGPKQSIRNRDSSSMDEKDKRRDRRRQNSLESPVGGEKNHGDDTNNKNNEEKGVNGTHRDDGHRNKGNSKDSEKESRSSISEREERKRKKKKKAKRKRSKDREYTHRDRDREGDRDRDRDRRRDRDRERKKNEASRRRRKGEERDYGHDRNKGRNGRRSSGASMSVSSRDVDDSFGHFEGGPGTIIHGQYKLLKDVGLGTFGRVVQAIDLKQKDRRNREKDRDRSTNRRERENRKVKIRMEDTVAIKIVRSVKRYHESALIEADILKDVNNRGGRGQSLVAVMLRQFDLPQGHCCLVFECLGRSLYDFMKTHGFKPFPLFCVRDFARQLLEALDFIHSFGLIHTDLKPENILLKSNKERPYRLPDGSDQQVPASTSIKLIDFGGATYDRDKKSTVINTRQYRAPEVILGLGWSTPSDLWSAGCIIAELYKGELLFATHDNSEHLALMERIIGRLPLDMVSRSKEFGTSVFDVYGWHKMELSSSSKAHVRKNLPLDSFVKEDDKKSGLNGLFQSLLTIDPAVRCTASDALKAPFFTKSGEEGEHK